MSEIAFARRLVPLKPGEVRDRGYTSLGLPLPEGMREETDAELRERIRAALKQHG